jgi:tRNA(fMet)-specific endonuclease VapC
VTSYSLDTNACIALINGRPPAVREQFRQAQQRGDSFAVSTIVLYELRYGVAKSQHPQASDARLQTFLAGPLDVLEFDEDDAADAGAARAALERAGKPVGAYDLLIAGQARRRGLTVVTANVSEFGRVTGLAWEDWGPGGSGAG